jgi:alkyldihydroxyacetonephosphate synthase
MRRWNGWGDTQTTYPFHPSAQRYLIEKIGAGKRSPEYPYELALKSVPASRLPDHPLIRRQAEDRLLHARGQSMADWIALRFGKVNSFPDGVAYPENDRQVQDLIKYAQENQLHLIPYGGGTSVVGHINPVNNRAPVLTIDLARLNRLEELDEQSRLATFGAGATGPELERLLREHGLTLGHFPQSFELSTLGGWVASRSCGQQSYHYGRIENLFAGGHLETPAGPLNLPALPGSAAGPDLRQLVLGSEGRLGILTRVAVRISPLPEEEEFFGVFFHDWEAGVETMKEIAQQHVPVSMARLSNAQETVTTLALAGKERLIAWADRGLRALNYDERRCLLIYGVTGSHRSNHFARQQANQIARNHGGLFTGKTIGNIWRKSRFLTPYLRNTLWEQGYAVDTLETALPWSNILPAAESIQNVIRAGMAPFDERVLVFAHLSHLYPDGASIYFTYVFRLTQDPDETLERWLAMKTAASREIVALGGTISHQHGVGMDHAAFLQNEKGALGIGVLKDLVNSLDPRGIMNPGKLVG